jgi:ergothioneine biosynthesis protein EgtB
VSLPSNADQASIDRTEKALSSRNALATRYQQVRRFSENLCQPLAIEDYVIQSMPDVSPTKWHLAHTSWFFETFVLAPLAPGYRSPHPQYSYLFNSYYVGAGERHCRPQRGLLSRPTVEDVYRYRAHVDEHMLTLLEHLEAAQLAEMLPLVELGLHHEQQHQELLLTDIKHVFSVNPLRPAYAAQPQPQGNSGRVPALQWRAYPEGLYWLGHTGTGFIFDNEAPRHRVFLEAFQLATRLVTVGEYLAFMTDGGYTRPELWLSEGWQTVQIHGWQAPLYWEQHNGHWWLMTLTGPRQIDENDPVCHVSYYEADAYARWAGARLPTEAEWEIAAAEAPMDGNFVERHTWHPTPWAGSDSSSPLTQMFGDVWEWTQSPYAPYPGYRPVAGTLGEYNGKFMCNQFVLRGGSCATSITHIRPTYRNFFPAHARWQFMGLRLAKDAEPRTHV